MILSSIQTLLTSNLPLLLHIFVIQYSRRQSRYCALSVKGWEVALKRKVDIDLRCNTASAVHSKVVVPLFSVAYCLITKEKGDLL